MKTTVTYDAYCKLIYAVVEQACKDFLTSPNRSVKRDAQRFLFEVGTGCEFMCRELGIDVERLRHKLVLKLDTEETNVI